MEKTQTSDQELKRVLIGFKKIFQSIGIFSFFINLLMLAPTFYMLQVYDRVIPSRNEVTLIMISLLLILFYFYLSFLDWIRNSIAIRLSNLFDLNLSEKVYVSTFKANLNQKGINASQFLGDLNTVRQFLNSSALFVIFDVPWFPINLIVIFLFNFDVGLFALFSSILVLFLAYLNERLSAKLFKKAGEKSIEANNLALNNLRNSEVIASMGMLRNLKSKWYLVQQEYLTYVSLANQKVALISSITKFFRGIFQSLILGLGAYLTLRNEISPGMMIAGSILMGRVLSPIESVIGSWKYIDLTRNAYQRLNKLLAIFSDEGEKLILPAPEGNVYLDQVYFVPPGQKAAIIKNISIKIKAGDVVGIIGPSGAGKSTLAKLILGIIPASSGEVRLDSVEIMGWNRDELGPHIGYLPQDIELFTGSVSENIARFESLDSEKVLEASKLAGIHDLVLHLPQGYETQIIDGGKNFSGGQRQRIGLARAIYGKPSVIVLDEPNSNADELAEIALVSLIQELKKSKATVIIISHRTQILLQTTKLMLLNDGVLQKFGPTQEVINELIANNERKTS
jgi:ATP-binding cassette subfamily C exporter for protease/lipase